jgi:uncharacterized protein (UPF0297 family)
LERDELLEEILRFYLEETENKGSV